MTFSRGPSLGNWHLLSEVGGGDLEMVLEIAGKKIKLHQLRNELFCPGGVNQENFDPRASRLERFWVVPMLYFFLLQMDPFPKWCRLLPKIAIRGTAWPEQEQSSSIMGVFTLSI
jgi:hypothetical protein